MTVSTEKAYPQNSSNRETRISRFLAERKQKGKIIGERTKKFEFHFYPEHIMIAVFWIEHMDVIAAVMDEFEFHFYPEHNNWRENQEI